MRLGTLTVPFGDMPLKDAIEKIKQICPGIEAVEIGTGNYPGNAHCDPDVILNNSEALEEFKSTIKKSGVEISALSCHGNPISPNKEVAKHDTEVHENTIKLAAKLGLEVVNCFSGCPGANPEATVPSWNVIAWPTEYAESLKWQWEEVVIPFWVKQEQFAADNNVKIAFEAHPGFVVYNYETIMKIRNATGKNIGANFDPSHFWWQGMDPLKMVRALLKENAVFHIHAKDTKLDPDNMALNGCNDTKTYTDELNRSWVFRTIGYGHSESWWRDFVSELRMGSYDGTLSIEHEDSLMSMEEGLQKAYSLLDGIIIKKKPGEAFWADKKQDA